MMPDCLLRLIAAAIALSALTFVPGGAAADEWRPEGEWRAEGRPGSSLHSGSTIRAPGTVTLMLEFAKLLRLDRPASTIIIGGPEIIDAAVNGASTIVLTGKAVGTTNMIILDDAGREISSLIVEVIARGRPLVTVQHGTERQTFSCAGPCEPVVSGQEAPTGVATAE